jgi:hypothetical protein
LSMSIGTPPQRRRNSLELLNELSLSSGGLVRTCLILAIREEKDMAGRTRIFAMEGMNTCRTAIKMASSFDSGSGSRYA